MFSDLPDALSGNNGPWRPRKPETFPCPSGQVVTALRPGPEFSLRAGHEASVFMTALSKMPDREASESAEDYGMDVMALMSDTEQAAFMAFARKLICAMVVSPKLVLNPKPEQGEIGPDDIGNDFWFLFAYGMTNFMGIKIPVGKTVASVSKKRSSRKPAQKKRGGK